MRGIRQRGPSWLVDVTVGGVRRTATCSTLGEAQAKRLELLQGQPQVPAAAPSWTLGEAANKTCELPPPAGWRGTRGEDTALHNIRCAVSYFGMDTPLAAIKLEQMEQYAAHLEAQCNSDGTINRKLAALSKVMTVAHQRGGLVGKPPVPRRKESRGRIRYLTQDEEVTLLRLLDQWGKHDHRDAIIVLIDTGLRVGELLQLEARDVDLTAGMIRVWENKADHPRSVPMTRRVRMVIADRMKQHRGRVFPHDHNWLRATWDQARSAMGFAHDKGFVPHALRHTCASRLIQRGVPLKVVQEWLGHKTITVTMRYAHLAPANLMAAVEALEPAA